jgi:transposase
MRGMARGYRPVDREQPFLLPPLMTDWLPVDHLVWFVIDVVQRLDTDAFHRRARLGGVGRRGYDPDMLVTLLVYAMAGGQRSSRRIEALCHTDVAFRVICGNDAPDHTVIARFRREHEAALSDLLTATLVLCAELGMLRLGVVAFDGVKIAGNASRDANRGEGTLRRLATEHLAAADVTDQSEDALFGKDERGDEIPEKLHDRTRRGARIQQALDEIAVQAAARAATRAAQQAVVEQYLQRQDSAAATGGPAPAGPRPKAVGPVAAAKARWEKERARQQARIDDWQARRAATGGKQDGPAPTPVDRYCRVRAARAAYDTARTTHEHTSTSTDGDNSSSDNSSSHHDNDGSSSGGGGNHDNDGGGSSNHDNNGGGSSSSSSGSGGSGSGGSGSGSGSGSGGSGSGGSGGSGGRRQRPRANLTDPQSRLLHTRNGWLQGYNCSTATSQDRFIIHADATQDANDVQQFIPTTQAITDLAHHLSTHTGRDDLSIGVMLGDAGYDSTTNLTATGPDRLIPNRNYRTTTGPTNPPPPEATTREHLDYRLQTPEGKTLYRQRSPQAETSHAWLKDLRGLRTFTRRGLTAARSEIRFAAAVTNLLRLRTLTTT